MICKTCSIEKSEHCFYFRKDSKKRRLTCSDCFKRLTRERNSTEIGKEKVRELNKKRKLNEEKRRMDLDNKKRYWRNGGKEKRKEYLKRPGVMDAARERDKKRFKSEKRKYWLSVYTKTEKYKIKMKKLAQENPQWFMNCRWKSKKILNSSGCYFNHNDYLEMYKIQDGKCAIDGCFSKIGASGKKLYVDHDHETGFARGLLCHNHNVAIGHCGESAEQIFSLYQYVLKSRNAGINSFRLA